MNINSQAVLELAKSFGRFIYFGLLGLIGTFVVSLIAGGSLNDAHVVFAGQTFNVGFIVVAGLTGLVKLLDRYQHTNPDTTSTGIAPAFLQR